MKVSIIIPIYNVGPYIKECLLSVINQTYQDFEVLLIDDCGNDNSINIAKDFIKEYNLCNKFKIIKHHKNKGLSAARNSGIYEAEGEYIYFLDSDDTITPYCIESLVNPTYISKYDFIIGNYKVIGNNDYPLLLLSEGAISTNKQILESFITGKWYVMAWNKLIKKDFLVKNLLYFKEGLLHEDELWSFQVACCANNMYVIENKTYNYFIRKNSITQSFSIKNINSLIDIILSCIDYCNINNFYNNINIYNYIENFKLRVINKTIKATNYKNTYQTYKTLRQDFKFTKVRIRNIINNEFNKQIRDLHYLFPKPLGYIILCIMLKYKSSIYRK